jgi:hypothetical protein
LRKHRRGNTSLFHLSQIAFWRVVPPLIETRNCADGILLRQQGVVVRGNIVLMDVDAARPRRVLSACASSPQHGPGAGNNNTPQEIASRRMHEYLTFETVAGV